MQEQHNKEKDLKKHTVTNTIFLTASMEPQLIYVLLALDVLLAGDSVL